MTQALQYLRSLLFIVVMYAAMAIMGLLWFPWALLDRRGAFHGVRTYCQLVRWLARWMVGLRTEVRGPVPQGEVLIASKHQSFLDIIMLVSVLPRPKFIMKRELLYAPILGQYGLRIGCIPVNRGKRAEAITRMKRDVAAGRAGPGQLIIYPQGTRIAPRVQAPYKIGTGVLYEQLGQPCVPVACNVGLFWPRHGILRKQGLAVISFLEPIAPGQPLQEFMGALEARIEPASDALMDEADPR